MRTRRSCGGTRRPTAPGPRPRSSSFPRWFCGQPLGRPVTPRTNIVSGVQSCVPSREIQEAGPQADLAVRDGSLPRCGAGRCKQRRDFCWTLEHLELRVRIDVLPREELCARNMSRDVLLLAPSIHERDGTGRPILDCFCRHPDLRAELRLEAPAWWRRANSADRPAFSFPLVESPVQQGRPLVTKVIEREEQPP